MDYIRHSLCICFLGLSLVGCSLDPYVKPTIAWEKDISQSSKPSVKAKVETGVMIR